MKGFLVAEEGALNGLTITLEDSQEWILGRDPDVCFQVLEDPMVSRKHVLIRLQESHFFIENLSATNPATVNGEPLEEALELNDQDLIKIGSTVFRFAHSLNEETPPSFTPTKSPIEDETFDELLSFRSPIETRWLLKVTLGPNTGAEFPLEEGKSYIIGKDQNCSIIFQDLSVSRQHAKLTLNNDETIEIEDMGSKNGVLVNGSLIDQKTPLASQDAVAIGTTTFVVIDRLQERETVYAPIVETVDVAKLAEKEALLQKEAEEKQELAAKKNWKETFIPTRHLFIGCLLLFIMGSSLVAIISLFHEEKIEVVKYDFDKEIRSVLKNFSAVTYNFDKQTGNLFLVGHVMTDVSYQELNYLLRTLPFIQNIEDNVIIDEYVWQNMNALLFKNSEYRSVLISGTEPGKFILRGYVQTPAQLVSLVDYVNINFPYLDRLNNAVVVEDNLNTKIQSQLLEKGYTNVNFQLSNGEIVFSGRLDEKLQKDFNVYLKEVGKNSGIRQVRNFVAMTQETSSRVDLSTRYTVTGISKFGDSNQFILINGKILSIGDLLDGMNITQINRKTVYLDKDGMKYKIDYNLQ
ncbi:MAG: EscD/YscD/HrpQ family type III secretion system inner membrane ring protein [Chlamydiae bacterium]|nr:EscD/YscD/HrpQ family type III secretion system inner membrane ring protein [Chlamydiota bacterium]